MWSFFKQNTKAIALLFGKNRSFSSLFNVELKSINFKFGHYSTKYQSYSLTVWPKIAHFYHFNVESKSINFKFGHVGAKYQGYSLTYWPNISHFHHFSMFNHNQSNSNLVICEENTKAIALLFGHKSLIFFTVQCSITINQIQISSFLRKKLRL